MTSFGYRLNPRFAIKECLSCRALYTRDFCCSKGMLKTRYLFLNSLEIVQGVQSVDTRTNVVNAPRESVVVKKDHGVNPPHINECCCECGNALDGIFYQQCICKSCGKDYTIAITLVLSTEEPVNSLSVGDEHLDTIPATESNELIKSSVEDLIPIPSEFEEEEIEDDNLREKLLNVQLLIANIEALKDNPTPSSKFLTKSSSTSPKSFLEETNT
nr:hypothetical protein [Tanacetum cinerariifolium]